MMVVVWVCVGRGSVEVSPCGREEGWFGEVPYRSSGGSFGEGDDREWSQSCVEKDLCPRCSVKISQAIDIGYSSVRMGRSRGSAGSIASSQSHHGGKCSATTSKQVW